MHQHPSRPLWRVRAEMAAEYPHLAQAADASDMKARFYGGVAHGDQEIGIEFSSAVICAGIAVPGILEPVKT